MTTRCPVLAVNPSTRYPSKKLDTGKPAKHSTVFTSGIEGFSLGEMTKTWKDTTTSEMRINLIDSLNKYQVGFNDVENFNLGLLYNNKNDGERQGKGANRDIVRKAMEYKRQDVLLLSIFVQEILTIQPN